MSLRMLANPQKFRLCALSQSRMSIVQSLSGVWCSGSLSTYIEFLTQFGGNTRP